MAPVGHEHTVSSVDQRRRGWVCRRRPGLCKLLRLSAHLPSIHALVSVDASLAPASSQSAVVPMHPSQSHQRCLQDSVAGLRLSPLPVPTAGRRRLQPRRATALPKPARLPALSTRGRGGSPRNWQPSLCIPESCCAPRRRKGWHHRPRPAKSTQRGRQRSQVRSRGAASPDCGLQPVSPMRQPPSDARSPRQLTDDARWKPMTAAQDHPGQRPWGCRAHSSLPLDPLKLPGMFGPRPAQWSDLRG